MTHFIDPSELRQNSQLIRYISDVAYKPFPDLEALTGADLMVSPDSLPPLRNEAMLFYHISQGAKLIQLKFGHDLPSSIVDGRLNESLLRMQATGAQPWQCVLLCILRLESKNGMAIIDGKETYTTHPMTWKQIQGALNFWVERGGSLNFPLSSGELIPEHLAIHQDHINRFRAGEKIKLLWPAQTLKRVDDLIGFLSCIPDAGMGMKKSIAIFDYMAENGIRQDWNGFINMTKGDKPELLNVLGIGKKTLDNILWGLYRTKEEREAKDGS